MPEDFYELRRNKLKGIGKVGRVAETKTGKRLGGRMVAASGAMIGVKGDIDLDDFLVENKSTVNGSMSLKLQWLQKISHEALGRSKRPALAIQFTDANGDPLKNGSYVMVSERDLQELIDKDSV